jgi:Phosphotransferase enzyme family
MWRCGRLIRVGLNSERGALNAARAVATAHGLACGQAVVMHSGSNLLVHLRPAPVVARVMTGTVVLHDDPRRWLEREVSVLEFLAPRRIAVAPRPLIGPGPCQHDGLWMTFSEWIPDVELGNAPADAGRLGRALRALHDELQTFDGDLGTLDDLRDGIERLHALLRPAQSLDAGAISTIRAQLDAAADAAFGLRLPAQALHGDASLSNLLHTPERLVWNDFEDTFRGPVHWDVAGYVISLRNRGANATFVRRVLDHYGWGDEHDLVPFMDAHQVYDQIWRLYDRQRRSAQASGHDSPPH